MFAILKTIKLSSKYQKKYSWLFSRMKIKKNEHYLSLGYYFKSELKDPNKFLPTCNPDDNQTNALSKESIQFRWWTGFYNEKTFEKRQLFLAHLIILWRIKKVSFQKKKPNEKCFQLCVFDQCSSEKMTDCPFFLDLGCISLRHMQVNQGQCTRFCLFDLHLTTDDCAVHSGPLIRGIHYTVSRNKTFLSYLIILQKNEKK